MQADWISLIRPTDGCVRYGIDQVGQAGDFIHFVMKMGTPHYVASKREHIWHDVKKRIT